MVDVDDRFGEGPSCFVRHGLISRGVADGNVLICCSRPVGDLVLDL